MDRARGSLAKLRHATTAHATFVQPTLRNTAVLLATALVGVASSSAAPVAPGGAARADDRATVAPISADEFARLHRQLVPAKVAAWQTIPWRVDLLEAREEAVRSRRPLFLWAMNGHPLGCV